MTTYRNCLSPPSKFQNFRDLAVHDVRNEGKEGILILMMILVSVMARLGGLYRPRVVRPGFRSIPLSVHKAGVHHLL